MQEGSEGPMRGGERVRVRKGHGSKLTTDGIKLE